MQIKKHTFLCFFTLFLKPNSGYYYTRYNKIVNKDNHPLKIINNGIEEQLWLSFNGMHLKMGLIYKF